MRPALLLCGSLILLACGPETGRDDEATATTGTAPGTTTGDVPTTGGGATDGTATTTATTTATASDPGTTGEPDVCSVFEDVVPAPAVTVTLRNAGAAPVFLNHVNFCDEVPLFGLSGPDADTPAAWSHGMCTWTCSEALAGSCGCPAFCPEDTVMMIAPGGAHTLVWSGAVYGAAVLPQACTTDVCGPECVVKLQAGAGTYTLRAVGATTVTSCADPDACTCVPNPEGWCDVSASSVGPEPREATAELKYPLFTEVELVFTDP